MNSWASRRKTFIFFVTVFLAILLVGVPAYFLSRNTPDCFNNVRDGDENGVDCGGSCTLLCTPEVLPLISRGDARLLRVSSSTYVISVLIENPNINGTVVRAPYTFSIYSGTSRVPVGVFSKETFIERNSTFALFEGPLVLEGEGPFRVVFEWGELVWEKSLANTSLITVEDSNLFTTGNTNPRLEANLINRSTRDENNVEVVALLYDASGNIVASNKTFVDSIPGGSSSPIVFSWPEAFVNQPVSIRIFPHVLPDKSYIR